MPVVYTLDRFWRVRRVELWGQGKGSLTFPSFFDLEKFFRSLGLKTITGASVPFDYEFLLSGFLPGFFLGPLPKN